MFNVRLFLTLALTLVSCSKSHGSKPPAPKAPPKAPSEEVEDKKEHDEKDAELTLSLVLPDAPPLVNGAGPAELKVRLSCAPRSATVHAESDASKETACGEDVSLTIDTSAIPEGEEGVRIIASMGEKAVSATYPVSKHATPPILSLSSSAAFSAATRGAVGASGACEDGQKVSVRVEVGGDTIRFDDIPCASGAWTMPSQDLSSYGDGPVKFTVSTKDRYGNEAVSEFLSAIDTIPPTLTIDTPASTWVNSINIGSFPLSVDCSEASSISVKVGGDIVGGGTCAGAGPKTVLVDLSAYDQDPNVTVDAVLTDLAGNISSVVSKTYNIKTSLPSLTAALPAVVNLADQGAVPVDVTCSELGEGIAWVVGGVNGSFTCSGSSFQETLDLSALSDGDHTATFTHSDSAGNPKSVDVLFRKKASKPVVVITSPLSGAKIGLAASSALVFSGSCSENGQDITIESETGSCSSGHFSITLDISSQGDGVYSFTASQTDIYGNTGDSAAVDVDLRVSQPTVTIVALAINKANDGDYQLSGTCSESGAFVEISGAVTGSAKCMGGIWAAPGRDTSPLAETAQSFTATHTDFHGNSASATASAVKDVTPPATSGVVSASNITPAGADLAWSEGTDTRTAKGDLRYDVYVSTSHLTTLSAVDSVGVKKHTDIAITSYSLNDLAPSTAYYAAVVVSDEAGNRALYGEASFTTLPPDPVAFNVTGPVARVASYDFTISWEASANAERYMVTISADKSCSPALVTATVTAPTTSYDYTAPDAGQYYACVEAEGAPGRRVHATNASTTSAYPILVDVRFVIGQADAVSVSQLVKSRGGNDSDGVAVYKNKLYVSDRWYHRVLVYNWPLTADNPAPVAVIGQPDFFSVLKNNDGTGNSARVPCQKCLFRPLGVAVQSSGGNPQYLWVADYGNHRVLRFDLDSATGLPSGGNHPNASLVLGQTSFTSGSGGSCYADKLRNPTQVAVVGNKIFVLAYGNRINYYDNPSSSGQALTSYLGYDDCYTPPGSKTPGNTISTPTAIFAYNDGTKDVLLCKCDMNAPGVWGFDVTAGLDKNSVATTIWGQDSFSSTLTPPSSGFGYMGGIFASSGKLYVSDSDYNRVVVYDASNPAKVADHVLGQPNLSTYGAPSSPSSATLGGPGSLAGDANGLIVLTAENRGYFFSGLPTADQTPSAHVLGVSSFTSPKAGDAQAKRFNADSGLGSISSCELEGRLYASDTGNNRVLVWDSIPNSNDAAPTHVIGQTNLTSNVKADTQNGLAGPTWLFCDKEKKKLFVTETEANRIKVFDVKDGVTNGMAAEYVMGQSNWSNKSQLSGTSGFTLPNAVYANSKNIFVADGANLRVLVFARDIVSQNQTALFVLGQSDFVSTDYATTQATLKGPTGLWANDERLYVADSGNNRVMIFDVSGSISNGMNAVGVLGKDGSYTDGDYPDDPTRTNMQTPQGVFYDSVTDKLYVSDPYYNRVLAYDGLPSHNAIPSSLIGSSPDFTSWNTGTVSEDMLREPYGISRAGAHLLINDTGFRRIIMRP